MGEGIDELLSAVEWASLYEATPTPDNLDDRVAFVMRVLAGERSLESTPSSYRESLLAARLLGDPPPA
jgi:hypothetical protein